MQAIISPPADRHLAAYQEIRGEVCKRYTDVMKQAGFFGRIRIWFRIEREIGKEMKKRFPPGALYTADPTK